MVRLPRFFGPCVSESLQGFGSQKARTCRKAQRSSGACSCIALADNGCGVQPSQPTEPLEPKDRGRSSSAEVKTAVGGAKSRALLHPQIPSRQRRPRRFTPGDSRQPIRTRGKSLNHLGASEPVPASAGEAIGYTVAPYRRLSTRSSHTLGGPVLLVASSPPAGPSTGATRWP